MKDKFEQDLFDMADREKLAVPQGVYAKVEAALDGLPKHGRFFRMNLRKSLVLAAVFVMLFSVTVSAAVGALRQRMEAMNEQEIEEYFANIYTSKIGVDNYNRPYTDAEKARMKALRFSYEEEAHFPDGTLTMISEPEEYKGRGVAFYADTTTFFFPDKEMSDEELLQVIDFQYKRDYSLKVMNEKIDAGEMEFPMDAINEKAQEIEATDSALLQSDAIWDPAQELTIPYTGNLEAHYMAAGQDCIFLTGWNAIHRMEVGGSDSTLFFDGFESETRVMALYQDKSGDIYLSLMQRVEDEDDDYVATMGGERYKSGLWILSNDGEVKKKIDISQYMDGKVFSIIRKIVVDEQGYIYAKTFMDNNVFMLVFDKEGELVTTIGSELYYSHPAGGLAIGKDGKVYVQVERVGDDKRVLEGTLGIAAVNVADGCLDDVYTGIVPDDIIQIDIIARGADTDFVFWGYGGIYTYNLGEESAVNILPAYEAPCDWEGVMNCALPDGRIVFGDCDEYRKEGDSIFPIPEKICFYYKSGLRNQ